MLVDESYGYKDQSARFVLMDESLMSITTEHTFRLVVLSESRFFFRRYLWDSNGGEERIPQVVSPRQPSGRQTQKLHGPVVRGTNGERFLVVDMGRTLMKGEEEEISFSHSYLSSRPKPYGFIGLIAHQGCERIQLSAILPRCKVRQVSLREYLPRAEKPYSETILSGTPLEADNPHRLPGGWDIYSAEIENPIATRRYRIAWDQITDMI